MDEIKRPLTMSRDDAKSIEGVDGVAALKESVYRGLDQFLREIESEMEKEISDLERVSVELERLSLSEDDFIESLSSLKPAPPVEPEVSVGAPLYEGFVVRVVAQIEEMLDELLKRLEKVELKKIQQFAVDLTLDPDTAHPALVLSDDGKRVHCADAERDLAHNPERLYSCVGVLGKERFSSGRFSFEVQVKGKSSWGLGVARESIHRKGNVTLNPLGGFWTITLINGSHFYALSCPPVRLSVTSLPERVGVFVDYEEGLVSFYDADNADLIYSFTGCSFTDKLHPFLSPCHYGGGKDSVPLTLCAAVDQ